MKEDYSVSIPQDAGLQSIENIRSEQERISRKIAQLRLEQSKALAEYEARKEEENSRGIVTKFWGFFTGKNKELKREVESSHQRAQAAGRKIEQLLEQNSYLQAEANRLAHARASNTMRNIAAEVVENIRDNKEAARKIENIEHQLEKIAAEIDQAGEKIGNLEDQHRNVVKLMDSFSKSIDSVSQSTVEISDSISKNYEHFVSLHEEMYDTFQKMNGIVEHQGNDILHLQRKVNELFDIFKELFHTLAENNKVIARQGESISRLNDSFQQEIEHGQRIDIKLSSMDEFNMQQAEMNSKQNEINIEQSKINEIQELQIKKGQQLFIVSLIIGSFGLVSGIILMVFRFIIK